MTKRKQVWTVRVINYDRGRQNNGLYLSGSWVDCLRYMGHCQELATFDNPERDVLEFSAPHGLDSKVWAEQNAARMRSFGLDAAAAPAWLTNGNGDYYDRPNITNNTSPEYAAFIERFNRRTV